MFKAALSTAQKKKVKEFREITGSTETIAKGLLRRFNYCLDDALEFHFSQQSASSARKNSCSKDSIEGIFKSYTYEDDPDVIYDEKLQAFLNDVGVNPSNLDALVVFRNLNCQNPGELTKQEFVEGFFSHNADSLIKMTAVVKKWISENTGEAEFRELVRWMFDYLKENKKSRTISKELGLAMWSILYDGQKFPLAHHLEEFLKTRELDVFNRDLWEQSYEFLRDMDLDLSKYDSDGAWPHILDEFASVYKTESKSSS